MERTLRAAAVVEAVSLVILLVNVFTVHNEAITSLGGPLHGSAYLTVIVTTLLLTSATGTRWRAAIPGVGGLLAVRRLTPGD